VTWQAHVDDKTSSKEAVYDMMMGMDLMTSIGMTVDCEQRCIRWGGTEIPLKTRNTLNNDEMLHMLYHASNEPDILLMIFIERDLIPKEDKGAYNHV
jgi:hypothetical protein